MTQNHQRSLNAVKLRVVLSMLLFLLAAGGVGLFFYGQQLLTTAAKEVSDKHAEATASGNNIATLQELQSQLHTYDDVPVLVDRLRADSDLPQFRALTDVRNIAQRYGVPVGAFEFVNEQEAAQPAAQEGQPAAPAQPSSTGAQLSFTVTNSVPYSTLINFLNAIEQNTPKLAIASVTLLDGSTASATDVSQLIVTLFTR